MADFYLFTPSRTSIDMKDSASAQYGLRLLVPLVGLALTGCAWPMAGDASKPELNAQAWVDQRYEHAKGLLAQGHYGLALENFRDVLRHDSYSVKALNGIGAAYDKLGRYDLAQRYYKKALVVEPTSFRTLNNIGYSYMLAGKYKEAREFLGKAAAIDAKNATLTANLKQLAEKEVAALSERNAVKASLAEDAAWADATKEAENARKMWVERSSSSVQVLITRPDSNLVEWAQSNGVEPRWVHVARPEDAPTPNRITVLTDRYPAVKSDVAPSQIAVAPKASDPAALPPVAVATSPAVTGPDSLSTSKAGAGDSPANVAESAAPDATDKQPSSSTAAKAASGAGEGAQSPVRETPVVAEDGGKPLDLTPLPAKTSGREPPVQSAGVSSATDASEPSPDAKTNWIESPWTDPRAENAAPNAVAESGPEAMGPTQQAAGNQHPAPDSDQRVTAQPPADAVAATSHSESAKQQEGNDQLAALSPAEPDRGAPGTHQDAAMLQVLEISNGAGRLAMAARMREHLKSLNIPLVKLTNAISFTNQKSVLYFKPGYEGAAMRVSLLLPLRPELRQYPALVPDLRLVLGGDMLDFDRQLIARNYVAGSTR